MGKWWLYSVTAVTDVAGEHEDALMYELQDMEMAIPGDASHIYAEYMEEVMEIMTSLRREWGIVYPEEEA